MPKSKKPRLDSTDTCVRIVEGSEIEVFSVKLSYWDNRTVVVKSKNDVACHHQKCKEKRAVHIASNTSFSCAHTESTKSFCDHSSAKNLTDEDIEMYNCDSSMQDLLRNIKPPQDFHHIVQISEHCLVVFTAPCTVNPTAYCHIQRQEDGHWSCSNSSCNRKTGNSKQLKIKKICIHLHVLFCSLKLSSPDFAEAVPFPPSASSSEVAITAQSSSSTSTSEEVYSVSRSILEPTVSTGTTGQIVLFRSQSNAICVEVP